MRRLPHVAALPARGSAFAGKRLATVRVADRRGVAATASRRHMVRGCQDCRDGRTSLQTSAALHDGQCCAYLCSAPTRVAQQAVQANLFERMTRVIRSYANALVTSAEVR